MNAIARQDITCKELVELVTDYLEHALPEDDRAVFEEHLAKCAGCSTYVQQIQLTIHATGAITEDTIDPAARDDLMRAFRGWHSRSN